MRQFLFDIGPISLPGYGFMLFVAFLACIFVSGRLAQRQGIAKEIVQDLAIWIFVGGIIGSRAAFLLLQGNVKNVWAFIVQFPRLWDGGVIFYGGAIGGAIAFALAYRFHLRKHQIPTWKLADIVAPSIALGLCLGRVGCLLNGCCYGEVACPHCVGIRFPMAAPARFDLVRHGYQTAAGFTLEDPLFTRNLETRQVADVEPGSAAFDAGLEPGDIITAFDGEPIKDDRELRAHLEREKIWRGHIWNIRMTVNRPGRGEETLEFAPMTLPIYPTQIYESISMLLLFLFLLAYMPFRSRDGQAISLFMIGYGIHRYFNELLRGDHRPTGFESWTSVILVIAGAALFIWLLRQPAPDKQDLASAPAAG
jgi:prolipoprotein diacylglyceryltransferase